MNDTRLLGHLVRDHGRTGPELDGLPLDDLHRFEHIEADMGLITLSHGHAGGESRPSTTLSRPVAAPGA